MYLSIYLGYTSVYCKHPYRGGYSKTTPSHPWCRLCKYFLVAKLFCNSKCACLFVWPSVGLSVCPSIDQSMYPSVVRQSVHMCVCLSVCMSVCSVSLFFCSSVSLSVCMSVCSVSLSVCQSVNLFVCQSVCLSAISLWFSQLLFKITIYLYFFLLYTWLYPIYIYISYYTK